MLFRTFFAKLWLLNMLVIAPGAPDVPQQLLVKNSGLTVEMRLLPHRALGKGIENVTNDSLE